MTVIVAVIAVVPGLVAEKDWIKNSPLAANPMAGLSFVQVNPAAPLILDVKLVKLVVLLLQ